MTTKTNYRAALEDWIKADKKWLHFETIIRALLIADRVDQLTKIPENVTCAEVSNAGESMDEKKRSALDALRKIMELHLPKNPFTGRSSFPVDAFERGSFPDYDVIADFIHDYVLQTPSVCTHSGEQSIETVPKSVADKMAEALKDIRVKARKYRTSMLHGVVESDFASIDLDCYDALAEYNNFKKEE